MYKFVIICVLFAISGQLVRGQYCNDTAKNKDNCGWLNMSNQDCTNLSCCWNVNDPSGPYCYHKIYHPLQYYVNSKVATNTGYQLILEVRDTLRIKYGSAVSPLRVDTIFETANRIRIKIYDEHNHRWEIPDDVVPAPPQPSQKPDMMEYQFVSADVDNIFWFAIVRTKTGNVIFNTSNDGQAFSGLQFVDQYLEISTQLPIDYSIYGLGT